MWTFGGGFRRFSDLLGVGVGSSGVLAGVTMGVGGLRGCRLDAARSWKRELKSLMRLVVDDGVRRFRLPDVVSVRKEIKIMNTFLRLLFF